MTRAYYNEIDPGAAATLRELISHNLIAPGDVDERSIEDVTPAELLGYSQCHFFAGVGVWSYALRLAGWPDDRPVWTGSCPCQPFSAAGKGKGFADERHLWPSFHHLISVCGPERVFGEQVAGKDGLGWLDLVSADVEAMGYTCGAVPFPAAGIGAPHIRERLYWVADALRAGPFPGTHPGLHRGEGGARAWDGQSQRPGATGGLADLSRGGWREEHADSNGGRIGNQAQGVPTGSVHGRSDLRAGPVNGHWGNADWLGCRDAIWRPVEPGTFPLAHGAAARVGRLRGYGNAIVAQQAQAFIEAYCDVAGIPLHVPARATPHREGE